MKGHCPVCLKIFKQHPWPLLTLPGVTITDVPRYCHMFPNGQNHARLSTTAINRTTLHSATILKWHCRQQSTCLKQMFQVTKLHTYRHTHTHSTSQGGFRLPTFFLLRCFLPASSKHTLVHYPIGEDEIQSSLACSQACRNIPPQKF